MSASNTRWEVFEEEPGRRTLRLLHAPIDLTTWVSDPVSVDGFTRGLLQAVDASAGAVVWGSGVLAVETAPGNAAGLWAPKFGLAGQTKSVVAGTATEIGATTAATLAGFGSLRGLDLTEDELLRVRMTTAGTSAGVMNLLLTLTNPLRLE